MTAAAAPFPTLLYEKRGPVARLSLNRPQRLNAYNLQMRDDCWQALTAVRDDPEVRALLLTGEGRAFCAGADLTEFGSAPSLAAARRVRWQRDVWGLLLRLPQPVVAAVHGHCVGSGVELALLCDLCIAADDAQFALPETQLGMIPAAGGTQTLPRAIGPSRALDLLLTGRRFGAAEAQSLGMITRIAPPEGLAEAAWGLARRLAALPAEAVAALKRALREGAGMPLDAALRLETRLAAGLRAGRPVAAG